MLGDKEIIKAIVQVLQNDEVDVITKTIHIENILKKARYML